MFLALQTQEHYALALERAANKSPQRVIPAQRELRTFDHPAHELRLAHVGSKRRHQAHMRWMLYKGTQRGFVLPCRERPESLRERARKNRVAEQTLRRCQLPHDLRRVDQELRHSPVALQREIREQRDEIAVGAGRANCSPRTCGHDSGILSHHFFGQVRFVLETVLR
jgi:hypothetical protein